MATRKKKSSSPAGEYIREEMHELKKGKLKNPQQAIAIGLSRARREGEDVPPPKKGTTSVATRTRAERDAKVGRKKAAAKKKRAGAKKSGARRKTAAKKKRK